MVSAGVLNVPVQAMRVAGQSTLEEYAEQVAMVRKSVGLAVSAIGLTRGLFYRIEAA